MAKLDGKVALITGAAAGLGEGIATAYAKYGAKLVMVDLSPSVEDGWKSCIDYWSCCWSWRRNCYSLRKIRSKTGNGRSFSFCRRDG